MKMVIALLFLVIILSCNREKRPQVLIDDNLTEEQVDSILNIFRFEYENPVLLDNSDYIIIPISTELLDKKNRKVSYSYSYSDYEYYPRYWNVLFYNQENDSTHLLTKEKFRISDIHYKSAVPSLKESEYSTVLDSKLLYEITSNDYNEDGKLNSDDPEFLYASEKSGKNLVCISPNNEDLIHHSFIPNTQEIILKTRRDTKKDSIFNRDDQYIWYKASLIDEQWELVEIVNEQDRDMIEYLYFDQWLKNK